MMVIRYTCVTCVQYAGGSKCIVAVYATAVHPPYTQTHMSIKMHPRLSHTHKRINLCDPQQTTSDTTTIKQPRKTTTGTATKKINKQTNKQASKHTHTRRCVRAVLLQPHRVQPAPCFFFGLKLRAQVLVTPGTTAFADTPSHHRFAEGYLLEAVGIEWFFNQYIDRPQRSDWRFAPLEADDLEGVAPACVVLAECDPLVDEGVAYADRLRQSRVAVELELVRGVTHDFIKLGRVLAEAHGAQALIGAALSTAFSH